MTGKASDFTEGQRAVIQNLAEETARATSERVSRETHAKMQEEKQERRRELLKKILTPSQWWTLIASPLGLTGVLVSGFVGTSVWLGFVGSGIKAASHWATDFDTSTKSVLGRMAGDPNLGQTPLGQIIGMAMNDKASMIFKGRADLGRTVQANVIDQGCWRTIAWLAKKLDGASGTETEAAPLEESRQPVDLNMLETCTATATVPGVGQLEVPFFARLGRNDGKQDDEVHVVLRLDWVAQDTFENSDELHARGSDGGIYTKEIVVNDLGKNLNGVSVVYSSLHPDLQNNDSRKIGFRKGDTEKGFFRYGERFFALKLNDLLPYEKIPQGPGDRFERYQHSLTVYVDQETLKQLNVPSNTFARVAVFIFVNRSHKS